VAEGVVDGLELVEIANHHGHESAPPAPPGERLVDAVGEEHPVGEPGEGIVRRLVGQVLLAGA
jgi:hypothetical protein